MFTILRPRAATIRGMRSAFESWRRYVPGLAATLAMLAVFTASASAATYGQLSSWGSYGFGSGQFANPVMLGVDSSDGSVFAGDLAKVNATTEDREYVRIQKLSASGTVLGSVQLPRYLNPTTNTKIVTYFGIGVDPVLQRFYVLEGGREKETFGEFVAKRILVFSTVPKEGKLVAPEGGPATIPVPANTLFKPRGIAVDPSNHDLIVMAENKSSPKHTSFQRVSSSGVAGALFSDAANLLRPAGETAAATFAVGPTGTIYAVTGFATETARQTATPAPLKSPRASPRSRPSRASPPRSKARNRPTASSNRSPRPLSAARRSRSPPTAKRCFGRSGSCSRTRPRRATSSSAASRWPTRRRPSSTAAAKVASAGSKPPAPGWRRSAKSWSSSTTARWKKKKTKPRPTATRS